MTVILVRGENNQKILNAIADVERHANLKLSSKPKKIDSNLADSIVEKILGQKLRTKSKVASAFFVKEDATVSILQIKKIHPPAHVVVVVEKYEGYDALIEKIYNAKPLKGYYSNKNKESSLKDYKYSAEKGTTSKIGY